MMKAKKLEKLRNVIEIRQDGEELIEGSEILIWIYFKEGQAEKIVNISDDVRAEFQSIEGLHMDKYVSKPYDANPWRGYVFWGGIMQGLVMLVIPLILIWEIPNMFYSPRTKSMVFEPIKSDWQNELNEAKLRKENWKVFEINVQYSIAFLAALIQQSPVGNLIEFVRKIAN